MSKNTPKKRSADITIEDIWEESMQDETELLAAECEYMEDRLAVLNIIAEKKRLSEEKFFELLATKLNINSQDARNLRTETIEAGIQFVHASTGVSYELSFDEYGAIWDESLGVQDHLIRFSDLWIAQYSPFRFDPELMDYVRPEGRQSFIDVLKGLSAEQQSFDRVEELIKENTSRRNRILRQSGTVYWVAWLRAKGRSLNNPISVQDVCEFIVDHIEGMDEAVEERLIKLGYKKSGPHKLSHVNTRLSALSVFYNARGWTNPRRDHKVYELQHSLERKYGCNKAASRAITLDILNLMLDTCNKNKMQDLRDKALLLFGWSSGGRRRSEIAAAQIEDLQEDTDGNYIYTMPQSKTDQLKEGHVLPVNGRAAFALKEWLNAAQITEGPIFRSITKGGKVNKTPLWGDDVHRIVKKRLKMAGLDDSLFGAHGLRSGFVTEAGRRNKPAGDVMALTTHKSHNTFMKYYRSGNIKHNSAANLADE